MSKRLKQAQAVIFIALLLVCNQPVMANDLLPPTAYPFSKRTWEEKAKWSGPFVLGAVGLGHFEKTTFSDKRRPTAIGTHVLSLLGGFNVEAGNWVVGGDVDLTTQFHQLTQHVIDLDERFSIAMRGRVGRTIANRLSVFGSSGMAFSHFSHIKFNPNEVNTTLHHNSSDARWVAGWQLGVGLDAMITDNLLTRIAYTSTRFFNAKTPKPIAGHMSFQTRTHMVKLGVGWKF